MTLELPLSPITVPITIMIENLKDTNRKKQGWQKYLYCNTVIKHALKTSWNLGAYKSKVNKLEKANYQILDNHWKLSNFTLVIIQKFPWNRWWCWKLLHLLHSHPNDEITLIDIYGMHLILLSLVLLCTVWLN